MKPSKNGEEGGSLAKVIENLGRPKGLVGTLKQLDEKAGKALQEVMAAASRDLSEFRVDVVFVGSFSSGKSTLVNKLLGEEVVPFGRGVVTSRPVWIGPGAERRVGWVRDGALAGEPAPLRGTIAEWVRARQDTAPEQHNEAWLGVELPTWPFDHGLKLLDTPGFNSEFPEHGARTRKALREAEVAIVVVEPRGMSTDVREFVEEHVAGKVPVVALVLNQLDLVESTEVPELLQRAEQHARDLGLEGATVIACSARGAADEAGHYSGWEGVREMLADLAGARVQHLVTAKVTTGVAAAVQTAKARLAEEKKRLTKSRALIEKELDEAEAEGLHNRIDELLQKARKRVEKRLEAAASAVGAAHDALVDEVVEWLNDDDNDPTEKSQVERMLRQVFKGYLKSAQEAFQAAEEEAGEEVLKLDSEIEKAVQKRWSRIAELCPGVAVVSEGGGVELSLGDQSFSFALGEMPSDTGGTIGGAALGAAVGTVVPFVGTIVGGIVGGFLGWIFGDARAEAVEKISDAADNQLEEIGKKLTEALEGFESRVDDALVDVCNRRWEAYGKALEGIGATLDERAEEVEAREVLVAKALRDSERALGALSASSRAVEATA